jgi:adenylate cyclase
MIAILAGPTPDSGHGVNGLALGTCQLMEIERKFLVSELPDLAGREPVAIEQGYLALADDRGGAEVRLRRAGHLTFLTVKSAGGLVRAEEEIELDGERFDALWPLTEGRRLEKERYSIDHGERTIELDVYGGELSGLAVTEVEFPDEGSAAEFEPPDWFGEEVTEDEGFRNEWLATRGMPR